MKKPYDVLRILMLLCVVGTAVFLILSPDRVPVHYNFAGEVDRIGSKYEHLVWPLFALGMGGGFSLAAKRQKEPLSEKIFLYSGICTLIFFMLLGAYFMWKAMHSDTVPAPKASFDAVNRFVNVGIGALLIVLGSIMPKARRNTLFGLRTKWSMANDTVWRKSQRFGGIATVIAGLVLILAALFVPGVWNILVLSVIAVAWTILCVVASHRYYRKDGSR